MPTMWSRSFSYTGMRLYPFSLRMSVNSAIVVTLGTATMFDWITKDFRVTTTTLLVIFAAFQVFAIGLLADLQVRLSKRADEVDPASR